MLGALEMAKASRTLGVAIMGRQLINNFIFLFEYLWVWGRQRERNMQAVMLALSVLPFQLG